MKMLMYNRNAWLKDHYLMVVCSLLWAHTRSYVIESDILQSRYQILPTSILVPFRSWWSTHVFIF